jgi:hypothetical protein
MSGQEFTAEDLDQMDFSADDLDAMDSQVKQQAPPMTGGLQPVEMPDESALYRQSMSNDIGSLMTAISESKAGKFAGKTAGDFSRGLSQAGSALGDLVVGSDRPMRVMNAPRRKAPDGRMVEQYSDGKWYPVGATMQPRASNAAQSLQPIEVINGVKYQLIDGKYKRVN